MSFLSFLASVNLQFQPSTMQSMFLFCRIENFQVRRAPGDEERCLEVDCDMEVYIYGERGFERVERVQEIILRWEPKKK